MLHAEIIKEIHREPCKGIGKPEALENEGREEVFPFRIMI
jgi:Txe/YoeB family toxin of Txe-Axe toxin-antitoxin module